MISMLTIYFVFDPSVNQLVVTMA